MEFEPKFGKPTGTSQETGLKTGRSQQEWDDMRDEQGNPQPILDMESCEADQKKTE